MQKELFQLKTVLFIFDGQLTWIWTFWSPDRVNPYLSSLKFKPTTFRLLRSSKSLIAGSAARKSLKSISFGMTVCISILTFPWYFPATEVCFLKYKNRKKTFITYSQKVYHKFTWWEYEELIFTFTVGEGFFKDECQSVTILSNKISISKSLTLNDHFHSIIN